ncbi:hypothetical protein N7468_003782 [Penicillium chermesinum]|uniref:Uncharacterized protein n=1 Tax=Penicillium chermesinum TaxID=63820 RepID=A0A9W9P759_9EURO|nr:uncharacterized protein N7468_003782 [Penicillium chermesinum]KAJ5239163.1 hypothetical protein N7468_003782 [Penicillium chermesinum]KAJ6164797.1 hypothetical protein N7470_003469 [Penicillium chermesinum]
MTGNKGAYQSSQKAASFEVRDGPRPRPGTGQVIIRNRAVALNLIDTWIQSRGNMYTWLTFLFVLG